MESTQKHMNMAKSSQSSDQELMTDIELIEFLRLPEVSTTSNYHNVISNLIRFRDIPRIRIGKKLLFPRRAIMEWIEQDRATKGVSPFTGEETVSKAKPARNVVKIRPLKNLKDMV